ncbi:DnaB-like helicase C-terminal domain-containing protein [Desulfurobacterium indicum]|uniref:SF4 helicase domain-containing protein n=1 Tax=Desulfurobacterium indicum TaxID=1914305 RepID=A0A1R1MJR8_9BACT|nr:DnaB-like helicase C-terminal domain-containing protein [Desulfurobacterium indicum]OMH39944.1 hypothetical protein BLW93_07925 [Desulfurobacterium indicum]
MKQLELEYSVIGSMLMFDKMFYYGTAFLTSNCFVSPDLKKAFEILQYKAGEGTSVEKDIVESWFPEELKNTILLAVEYAWGNFEKFKSWCSELLKRANERKTLEIAQKLADGEISKEKALELLAQNSSKELPVYSSKTALAAFLELYENEDSFPSVPTYVEELDLNFSFEYLTIIAARPSIGKTVFALSLMKRQAENGHPVLFFSQELPVKEEVMARLIAMELDVPLHHVKQKWVGMEKIIEASGALENLPMEFVCGKVTVPQFMATVYAYKEWLTSQKEKGIIYVDYLQLFAEHRKFDTKKAFYDYVVETCVELTKELKIPIVLLAQINREARTGKKVRPTMDQIKGSGDIEQQATNIIVLHRDFENKLTEKTLQIFIDKCRLKGVHR